MRHLQDTLPIAFWTLLAFASWWTVPGAAAADDAHVELVHAQQIRQAERNVQIAQIRYRQYIRVEYPLRLRELNNEIKIGEAEIRLLRRRVDAFRFVTHNDRNDYNSPTTVNIKQLENALFAAELHLEQIKAERTALYQSDRDRRTLLKLEWEAACEALELLQPKAAEPQTIRNDRNAA